MKKHIQYTLRSFWLYGPGVLTVLLSYVMLITLSQGQDVVMLAGEKQNVFLFAALCISLWAFFVWYSSRIIGYEKKFDDPEWPTRILSVFPRLLAYNAFVSVQAAILALPTLYNWSFFPVLVFVVGHNGYYFLLEHAYCHYKTNRVTTIAALLIALAYMSFFFFTPGVTRDAKHQHGLPTFGLLLFMFQLGSLAYFVWRRVNIDKHGVKPVANTIEYVKIFGVNILRVPAWFRDNEQTSFNVFNVVAVFAVAIFITVLNSIPFATHLGPLAIVLLAFGVLVGGANIFSYISLRTGFNFFIILFFIAVVVGILFRDPYEVELTKSEKPFLYAQRPSFDTYFRNWINEREEKIAATPGKFSVYLVLADGGASRSGYWVASVLAAWEDESIKKKLPNRFSDHLLCLSGASGGSVGNATFYALLRQGGAEAKYRDKAQNFLKQDFLSSCVAHYLGTDLIKHILPWIPAHDRAEAISESMKFWSEDGLDGLFGKNVDEVYDLSGKLPLLFINTTRVQEGTPAVVSPVKLHPFSLRLDVLEKVDSTGLDGYGNISYGNATMLSARFPYVSPAGKIGKHFFVDGGYFDNSGAGVVHEMLQYIQVLKKSDTTFHPLLDKLDFHLVHITNTPDQTPIGGLHPVANELAAPLLTVFNTYDAQTEVNDKRLESFLNDINSERNSRINNINLYREGKRESYPMSWVISEYRRIKMDERLDEVVSNEILNLLKYESVTPYPFAKIN